MYRALEYEHIRNKVSGAWWKIYRHLNNDQLRGFLSGRSYADGVIFVGQSLDSDQVFPLISMVIVQIIIIGVINQLLLLRTVNKKSFKLQNQIFEKLNIIIFAKILFLIFFVIKKIWDCRSVIRRCRLLQICNFIRLYWSITYT